MLRLVLHKCSYDIVTAISDQSFLHHLVKVRLGYQVPNTDLDRYDIVLLDNDGDIGGTHPILLSSFPGSVVAVIRSKVSSPQFIKMVLGVVGLSVFTLRRNMMAIGVRTD